MRDDESLAAKPEAFRGLLDDAEFFAVKRWRGELGNKIVQDIVRECLELIRAGRMAFKNWECI